MQHCYTSKSWHVGSNAYAPTPSCLADDRASFWFSCNQRRPAAASQLYFRTPGLDRNGVSRVVRIYQIPVRQELSQWSALSCPEAGRAQQIEWNDQ